jgi:hypothetical protein
MFFQFFYFKIEIPLRNIISLRSELSHQKMTENNSQNPESKLDFAALYPSIVLPFWFGNNRNVPDPDPSEEREKEEIGREFDQLDQLNLNESIRLLRKLRKLRDLAMKKRGPGAFDAGVYGPPLPYAEDCNQIGKRINQLLPIWGAPIILKKGDIVNGHKMPFDVSENIMHLDIFLDLAKVWYDPRPITECEFFTTYSSEACTEWSKHWVDGESYGGPWRAEEGSEERTNAWNICREENGKALWNLPYPKRFVLRTIRIGCSNRLESVPYSNMLCVWMERKLRQLEVFASQEAPKDRDSWTNKKPLETINIEEKLRKFQDPKYTGQVMGRIFRSGAEYLKNLKPNDPNYATPTKGLLQAMIESTIQVGREIIAEKADEPPKKEENGMPDLVDSSDSDSSDSDMPELEPVPGLDLPDLIPSPVSKMEEVD